MMRLHLDEEASLHMIGDAGHIYGTWFVHVQHRGMLFERGVSSFFSPFKCVDGVIKVVKEK